MSIEDTKAKIAVMQAYVDGKPIEYIQNRVSGDNWDQIPGPSWNWAACDYRVAPPKPEAVYKLRDVKGTCRGLYEDEQSATEIAKNYGFSVHKFVEVL